MSCAEIERLRLPPLVISLSCMLFPQVHLRYRLWQTLHHQTRENWRITAKRYNEQCALTVSAWQAHHSTIDTFSIQSNA